MFLLVKHKRSLCKAGIKQTCFSFMCSSASHRADCDSCCTPHLFIAPASPLGGDVVTAYLISLPKCSRPMASGVTVSQHQPLNQLYNSRLYIHFTFVLLHHWLVACSDLGHSQVQKCFKHETLFCRWPQCISTLHFQSNKQHLTENVRLSALIQHFVKV